MMGLQNLRTFFYRQVLSTGTRTLAVTVSVTLPSGSASSKFSTNYSESAKFGVADKFVRSFSLKTHSNSQSLAQRENRNYKTSKSPICYSNFTFDVSSSCKQSTGARNNSNVLCKRFYSKWEKGFPLKSHFNADLEGEPYKTTVTLENTEGDTDYVYVESYSRLGFKLSNGMRIVGPLAMFPKTCLHWNVNGAEDIHMHSLSLFTVLEPKLDILLIGVGEPSEVNYVDKDLYRHLKEKGISLELLSTHQACATFNFLNSEKRCVAAAFLPPKRIISRNMHEFMLADSPEPFGELLSKPEPFPDPVFGNIGPKEDEKEKEELSPGYWDDGVKKPPTPQQQLDDSKKDKDPKLPDGRDKS
ncbi:hypothetical protein EB796_005791 [Bugula neritina]|uniref:NADH dehydrogenase [ubiquinone] 1 alpha subcomplex assembly factor 3 n=1 Tax=Bugula neritina TaxID=10212 RepID=A0A7J7KCG4_BUGNE|nr:hypothetical protein EB796_005791 [Bugula neritina]